MELLQVYEISSDGFECQRVETGHGELESNCTAEEEGDGGRTLSAWLCPDSVRRKVTQLLKTKTQRLCRITSLEGKVGFWQTEMFMKDAVSQLKIVTPPPILSASSTWEFYRCHPLSLDVLRLFSLPPQLFPLPCLFPSPSSNSMSIALPC